MSNVDIVVIRGDGLRQGADIEDRLICEVIVAIERGRNECDENSGLQSIAITSVQRASIRPGMTVRVEDSLQGASWVGKIAALRHNTSEGEALTELTIQRPQ